MSESPSAQNPLQGMAIMAGAMAILPTMDAIAKYMATFEAMSPGQVTFYRFFFQLVCTLPILLAMFGRQALSARRPWMNLLRGALHGAASLLFFVAVKYMPLADVFAIYFVEPFILTAMSAAFLGEKVGWRRWLAIIVGFGGALIVIQPSFILFGWTALLPVACAFLYSIYLFMNRAIGNADSPLTMQTIAGFGGTYGTARASETTNIEDNSTSGTIPLFTCYSSLRALAAEEPPASRKDGTSFRSTDRSEPWCLRPLWTAPP